MPNSGSTNLGNSVRATSLVLDTFPWPQSPTLKQVQAVAKAAVALRGLRRKTTSRFRKLPGPCRCITPHFRTGLTSSDFHHLSDCVSVKTSKSPLSYQSPTFDLLAEMDCTSRRIVCFDAS